MYLLGECSIIIIIIIIIVIIIIIIIIIMEMTGTPESERNTTLYVRIIIKYGRDSILVKCQYY